MKKQVVLFLLLFVCLLMAEGLCAAPAEYYALQNAKPAASPVLRLADGRLLDPWQVLPEGWTRVDEDTLLTQEGVLVRKDGTIEIPFGDLPQGYRREADGSLVTKEGFRLLPKARGELVTAPQGAVLLPTGQIKVPEKRTPEQLWSMLPLTDVQQKEPSHAAQQPSRQPSKDVSARPKEHVVRRGEHINIPKEAPQHGKLDFLEGCWVSDPITGGSWNDPKLAPTTSVATMCFNKFGKGQITVRSGSLRCRGGARAFFSGKDLTIDSDNATCPPNPLSIRNYTLRHWKCVGVGSKTQCFLLSVDPGRAQNTSKYKTRLRKL